MSNPTLMGKMEKKIFQNVIWWFFPSMLSIMIKVKYYTSQFLMGNHRFITPSSNSNKQKVNISIDLHLSLWKKFICKKSSWRQNSAYDCMALHCTEPFIIILPSTQYGLNNVEWDIKHQIVIIMQCKSYPHFSANNINVFAIFQDRYMYFNVTLAISVKWHVWTTGPCCLF